MSDDVKVINAPERIWLQIGDDFETDEVDFDELDGVTWCADSQFETDIAYVRADLYELRIAELTQALVKAVEYGQRR